MNSLVVEPFESRPEQFSVPWEVAPMQSVQAWEAHVVSQV